MILAIVSMIAAFFAIKAWAWRRKAQYLATILEIDGPTLSVLTRSNYGTRSRFSVDNWCGHYQAEVDRATGKGSTALEAIAQAVYLRRVSEMNAATVAENARDLL